MNSYSHHHGASNTSMAASLILLWLFLAFPSSSLAHSLNDSYLDLTIESTKLSGTVQLAITDLEIAVGLDSNNDTKVSWGEVNQAWGGIHRYVLSHINFSRADRNCSIVIADYGLSQLRDTPYIAMSFTGSCQAEAGDFMLQYSPMFDLDNSHRGFVSVSSGGISSTHILNPQKTSITVDPAESSLLLTLLNFIIEGVWHIWIGIDHILFLIAMLLGVVLYRKKHEDVGHFGWRGLGREVFRLVTAFTVAHSITLVLATLELVSLPSQLIEASIALSVVISGINIIYPIFGNRHWQFAFAFGLIHGFGFANVLADLNLASGQFLVSLLGFNLGVEIGQLLIVALAVPLLVFFASQHYVQRFGATVSGLFICNIGLFWLIERSL